MRQIFQQETPLGMSLHLRTGKTCWTDQGVSSSCFFAGQKSHKLKLTPEFRSRTLTFKEPRMKPAGTEAVFASPSEFYGLSYLPDQDTRSARFTDSLLLSEDGPDIRPFFLLALTKRSRNAQRPVSCLQLRDGASNFARLTLELNYEQESYTASHPCRRRDLWPLSRGRDRGG